VAERLGVAGEVRNRPDGSVEVVAEGESDAVEQLVAWCREGPQHGRVSSVDVVAEEPQGCTGFRVTY
jgi:acylphosphatase